MEEFADWDLLAVVRSCYTTTAAATSPLPPPPPARQEELLYGLSTLFEPQTTSFLGGQQVLQDTTTNRSSNNINISTDFIQSIFSPSSSSSLTSPVSSSSSSILAGRSYIIGENPLLRRLIRPSQVVFRSPPSASISQLQRTKKRKNLIKNVCHVAAEGLSNDMWAWRKYGQKPIKGSPYPRGYYRCSSSKGCLARKQVERNRSDPKMFIVTYTGEHNHSMPTHRNSLAGSTRHKSLSADAQPHEQLTCSSPSTRASLSPPTEKSESKTEEDNDMGISDLMLNDDFFVGFEKIDGDEENDCFSDHFSPSMEFPWLANSSSTAAAAGGL